MRELAILTFITLDGVMQAPVEPWEDRTGDFIGAGWAKPYWEGVMAQVSAVAMNAPYDMLLGRTTYDNFHRAAKEEGDLGNSKLTDARKYVVTSASQPLSWANSIGIKDDIAASIERLKSDDGPLLQVHGSWELIQFLLAHDLIDELRLWIFPVMLGSGKRLFSDGTPPRKFDLVRSEPTGNGAVMSIYRKAA